MYVVDTYECTLHTQALSFEIRVLVEAVPDLLHTIYK